MSDLAYEFKAGATSKSINVFIQDSTTYNTTGAGKTGLVFNTSGLIAYYSFTGAAATSNQITLATLSLVTSAWASGGFKEIDATNMPGWYRLDLPNAVIAAGNGTSVNVNIQGASGMVPCRVTINLVAYDPTDATHLGLSALPNVAAGGTNGLVINGTNTGTVTLGALAVVGTSVFSGNISGLAGVTLTQSSTNVAGLSITGNGTAAGISATGGGTGAGILATGGGPGGAGMSLVGGNASAGNAAGVGLNVLGGTASTSSGGTSGVGVRVTGGTGAASTNGASDGLTLTGGGTTTVTGGSGATITGTGNLHGLSAVGTGSGVGLRAVGGASGVGLIASGAFGGANLSCTGASGNGLTASGGTAGVGFLIAGGSSSGAGVSVTTTSGDGLSVTPTAGNAVVLTANGTSKHGLVATGGTAGTSDGIKAVAGTGGVDFRAQTTNSLQVNAIQQAGVTLTAPPLISATVVDASPTTGSFKGVTTLSSTDNFYNGLFLVFTTGAVAGIPRKITSYTGATRLFTFSGSTGAQDAPFPTAPANGDAFDLIGHGS